MEDFFADGTIPPFGNWDYADELSYTHYFSCALQASAASTAAGYNSYYPSYNGDLYATHTSQSRRIPSKMCVKEHERKNERIQRKQADMNHQRKLKTKTHRSRREGSTCQYVKPVDEDLYKIPTELIRAYKKKKMVGFFSRLLPTCIR